MTPPERTHVANPVHTNYEYRGETVDVFAQLSEGQLQAIHAILNAPPQRHTRSASHFVFQVADRDVGDRLCDYLRGIAAEHYRERVYAWAPAPVTATASQQGRKGLGT